MSLGSWKGPKPPAKSSDEQSSSSLTRSSPECFLNVRQLVRLALAARTGATSA
jgi:hypothetical protein